MGFEYERDIKGGESKGEAADRERRAAEDKVKRDKKFADRASNDPNAEGIYFSGDEAIREGQMAGLTTSATMYGQSLADTGREVKDVISRRKDALDSNDPASTRMRNSKNAQIRAARATGANGAQQAQIERQAAFDIGQSEHMSQAKALDSYQSLLGNIIGGTTSLMTGMAGLEKSGEVVEPPTQDGSSVICTELNRQGYMSDELHAKDEEHGRFIRSTNPLLYIGYFAMARHIVPIMKRSRLFTFAISLMAMPWARHMAGERTIVGRLINKYGSKLCQYVGESKLKNGELYEV